MKLKIYRLLFFVGLISGVLSLGYLMTLAAPIVNILGDRVLVALNATTTANANFTASGTIAFITLQSAGGPCLSIGATGLLSTSTCGAGTFTTTTINGISATSYTFATSGADGLFISTSTGTVTWRVATSSASASGFLTAANWTTFNDSVDPTRAINAGSNLLGGGDLSADRTIWLNTTISTTTITTATTTRLNVLTTITIPNASASGSLSIAGSLAINNGSSTFNFYDNTAERVLDPLMRFTVTVPAPTSTAGDRITNNIILPSFDYAVTITKVACRNAATSSNVTFQMHHGSSATGTNLFSDGQVCANTTSTLELTTFNDATLNADDSMSLSFSVASSSQFSATVYYRRDP